MGSRMLDSSSRLFLSAVTLTLVTALAGAALAQDRPHKPAKKAPAAAPAKKRPAKKAQPPRKSAPKKRGALTKRQRDAQDDALFGDESGKKAPPRPPVSTAGPWPAEDDAPWPTEDPSPWPTEQVSPEEEEALFADLDDDMESPEGKREAEERGATAHHHGASVPSPDGGDWAWKGPESPDILAWEEGADTPDGYVKATRVRKGLVITGAVLFGVSWLATAGYGTWLINERDPDYWDSRNDEDARPEAVLYVPLVGPWIALGTVEHDSREGAAFVTGGLVQAGSLAMLIAGVAAKKTVLVKTDTAELGVAPTASGGMLHGKF